jgi:hypothetical protein
MLCARDAPTFVLFATNLAQQHPTQLLAPVDMFRVVLLDQAVKVALSLVVWRAIELRFGGSVPQRAAFLADNVVAVRFDGEDRPEARQWLCHGDRLSAATR